MRVFITGGRSGIGYEVGKFLAERGHLVYLGCRTVSQVFSLREKLKGEKLRMIPIKFDITSSDIFMPTPNFANCFAAAVLPPAELPPGTATIEPAQ